MKRILFYHNLDPWYGYSVINGLSRFAETRKDWKIQSTGFGMWPNRFPLNKWNGDGIILMIANQETYDIINSKAIPFVNLTVWPNVPNVVPDHRKAGAMGAEYFIKKGFRHFAFCKHSDSNYGEQQYLGFKDKLQEYSYSCNKIQIDVPKKRDGSEEASLLKTLENHLKQLKLPVAMMTSNDHMAVFVNNAAHKIGINIPNQIALLGVYNEPIGKITSPSISSIELNGEEAGFHAAKLLDQLMNGERTTNKPPQILIPPLRIIERNSTKSYAYNDPSMGAVIEYIKQHANAQINIELLLPIVNMSRRTLERRFLKETGTTLWRAIRNHQIEQIKSLLVSTHWPIKQIAQKSAFHQPSRMIQVFREETHETPLNFRKRYRNVDDQSRPAKP